ncbi:DUF5979 domain-containing protein [Actinomyces wuliandei]|uniref:DUF7926 domain-containing protein n=1 Tax=Actinomyces wuliandei TaxID=2057743 RepID=UPI000FDCA94C|nr:DUF5979 domain-containing protein [Actinomyces wuliandei]
MNTVSTGIAPRRALAGGAVAVLVAALALALAVVTPLASSAQAEENTGITVSNMSLTRVNGNNEPQEGALLYYDNARLTFDWDASSADLQPGDSFTINLGTYFENLQRSESLPMTVSHDGSNVEIGTCELTAKTIVCTFSDQVTRLRSAGFHGFKGQGTALLAITETTTSATADITANGTTSVDLPGEGGIGTGPGYGDWEIDKWASSFYNDYSELTWGVNFGSNYVADQLGLTLDGQTRQTVTFTDELGAGSSFSTDMSRWTLALKYLKNDSAGGGGSALTRADGTDDSTERGDFDMDVSLSSDGRTATISITGPFEADADYAMEYPVSFDGGQATQGVSYTNSVALDGTGAGDTETRSYVQYFDISVEMERGFGTFNVTKTFEGDLPFAAEGSTFVVDAAYELPAPASSYSGWSAPEGDAPSGDERSGTTSMTVTAGERTQFDGTFPVGTTVTLSEHTSDATTDHAGYSWGEPVFVVEGERTGTFTIGDQVSTSVSLINTVVSQDDSSTPAPMPTEDEAQPQPGATSTSEDPPGGTGEDGGNQATTAQADPAPATQAPTPSGGGQSLARTGANVAALLALAGAGIGGGALLLSRRRRSGGQDTSQTSPMA